MTSRSPGPASPPTVSVRLGPALRAAREGRGLSLRELARRVNVSPSFVSQIELDKANPSVGTLYALVTELGTSLDELMGDATARSEAAGPVPPAVEAEVLEGWERPGGRRPVEVPVQPVDGRRRVQMSGVVWERLTHDHDPFVDFLHVEYAPGSASCPDDQLMRHGGREYGHVLRGRLDVQVGFETYALGPGDSIHFDSATPHRLSNPGDEACTAIWFVLARENDQRMNGLEPPTRG